jgi:hypothetical protein
VNRIRDMKSFFGWTAAAVGIAFATVFTMRAIQTGRQKVKSALGEAEAVADQTRAALEQTQGALRMARQAI